MNIERWTTLLAFAAFLIAAGTWLGRIETKISAFDEQAVQKQTREALEKIKDAADKAASLRSFSQLAFFDEIKDAKNYRNGNDEDSYWEIVGEIDVERPSVMIATTSASGVKDRINSDKSYGMIRTTLKVGSQDCAMDISGAKVASWATLASSSTCMQRLSPGIYSVRSDILYYGNVSKQSTNLSIAVFVE
ncbi:hypothetical protein [Endothiovibrio diazotrophicus]